MSTTDSTVQDQQVPQETTININDVVASMRGELEKDIDLISFKETSTPAWVRRFLNKDDLHKAWRKHELSK